MNFLLLLTLYTAMFNRFIEGQSVNGDQPSDKMQQLAGLLDNVMQLLYKQQQQTRQLVSDKFDRLNEVISHLNRTVNQQQGGLTNLNQTLGQLNGSFYKQHVADSILRQLELNQTVRQLHGKLDLQSQHFNQTLSRQQRGLSSLNQTVEQMDEKIYQQSQKVANSILQQLELGLLCSSKPWPTVSNAALSVKQTSNETIITYWCNVGYEFKSGLTMRSTACNGTSWTPVDGNCTRHVCRPVLTHVIRGDHRYVVALTSFNDQLFVTRIGSPIVEVYDTATFAWIRNITGSEMGVQLQGLAHCPAGDCLYVSDYNNRKVHKVNLPSTPGSNTAATTTSWSMGASSWGLSVNRQQNLLVVLTGRNGIVEYSSSGSMVREMSDGNQLWHAVEHVVNGTFVVSRRGPVHGVALMSVDGRVIHSYGSATPGSGPGQMNDPRSLAVTRDGYVLVADQYNNRILVLSPTLSAARLLPLPTDATGQAFLEPRGLWLDESRGRLYVGQTTSQKHVWVYDNVWNVETLFTR